jgi:alpha-galactosidase
MLWRKNHFRLWCSSCSSFWQGGFLQIGADVGLCWENKAYSREDVSTQNTLTNTIYRRHLDGRAWLNDPDVFLLRANNIKMPLEKRIIVAKVNSLCGNLLFVSDDVSTYAKEQKEIFLNTISSTKANIISAEIVNNIVSICTETECYRFNIATGEIM